MLNITNTNTRTNNNNNNMRDRVRLSLTTTGFSVAVGRDDYRPMATGTISFASLKRCENPVVVQMLRVAYRDLRQCPGATVSLRMFRGSWLNLINK